MAQPSRAERIQVVLTPVQQGANEDCVICYLPNVELVSVSCNGTHVFCKSCIENWLLTQGKDIYPNCRESILQPINDANADANNLVTMVLQPPPAPPPAPWSWEAVCSDYGWDSPDWTDGDQEVVSMDFWVPQNALEVLLYGPT